MEARSLAPLSVPMSVPVAQMRRVFQSDEVERKLAKLEKHDHDVLRATYRRMLERGPLRFQVKPSGLLGMASLYQALPNFTEVLDDVKRHIALAQNSRDALEIPPILLLGPAGIGKTHFAKMLANLLGTNMYLLLMNSTSAHVLLSGSSSRRGAKAGKVFEALVDGEYANPILLVDGIDKISVEAQHDVLGPLSSLLDRVTAQNFTDEFAEVAIDASQVIWIMTAYDERMIPEPILNRMNIFVVERPTPDEARQIACNLYQTMVRDHAWGESFAHEPQDAMLDQLSKLPLREMGRALMTGFGNAMLGHRDEVGVADLPKANLRKGHMGFLR